MVTPSWFNRKSGRGIEIGCSRALQMVTAAMKLKDAYSLEGKYDQPR